MKQIYSILSTKNLIVFISTILSIIVVWNFRDSITESIFPGKSFSGRSLQFQLLFFVIYFLFSELIIYNILMFLFPGYLFAKLQQNHEVIKASGKINFTITPDESKKNISPETFLSNFIFSFISVFTLLILEWVFIISKESFMDDMAILEKIAILFQSIWIIFVISSFMLMVIWFFTRLFKDSKVTTFLSIIMIMVPGLIFTISAMLVFDNFTYIILGKGIVNTNKIFPIIYALGFVLFFNKTTLIIKKYTYRRDSYQKVYYSIFGVLFGLSTLSAISGIFHQVNLSDSFSGFVPQNQPNILLIGADGLNADHVPVYGYHRNTTPFLNSIVNEVLISENNFSNAGSSAGSVVSIFTSKPPFSTRVLNLPDALRGTDAYEHLPGLLNDSGYYNVEITYMRYVDAYLSNVRNGFDRVNGKEVNSNLFSQLFGKIYPVESQYFLDVVLERVSDRLLHIFMIRKMPNPYLEIHTPNSSLDYQYRIPELMKLAKSSDEPFFFHVHLLGTHGPFYHLRSRNFSGDQVQTQKWETDFYDDAILEFDMYIKDLYKLLQETGRLENTIIIIYSDHPQSRDTTERIPLIIRFPNGDFSGRIKENTQNMDISPTILTYLGIPQPRWMEGESMIGTKINNHRIVYSATWRKPKEENQNKRVYKQFGSFRAISCDSYVEFSAISKKWSWGKIAGHTSPCSDNEFITYEMLQDELINRIRKDGFPTEIME